MDNTKAIALLRRMQEPEAYEPKITAEAFEALGMAIKALEQADHIAEASKKATQPEPPDVPDTNVGDTISRQAAIRWVKTECNPYGKPTLDFESGKKVIEHLKQMPSAQAERKKPVFKTGESVYHVSYADGTGGFEKNKWADWTCPDCGWFVGEQYIPRRHNQQKCNYCAKCGCAIDWSEADMRGEQDG